MSTQGAIGNTIYGAIIDIQDRTLGSAFIACFASLAGKAQLLPQAIRQCKVALCTCRVAICAPRVVTCMYNQSYTLMHGSCRLTLSLSWQTTKMSTEGAIVNAIYGAVKIVCWVAFIACFDSFDSLPGEAQVSSQAMRKC